MFEICFLVERFERRLSSHQSCLVGDSVAGMTKMQRQQRRRIETTYAPLPNAVMLGRKSNKQYVDHRQGAIGD